MSQHHAHAQLGDQEVAVLAGHDRPPGELFLQVRKSGSGGSDAPCAEDFVYSSISGPRLDWTDIGTVEAKLAELGITVPYGLLDAVYLDPVFNAGNRVVRHRTDQAPEVLRVG